MSAERDAVLAANEAFYRAFEKRNFERMEAVWSQGISSLCAHPGRLPLEGWSNIGASWQGIFRNIDYIEIETEIISAEVNGDLAYVVLVENVLQVVKKRRIEAQSLATNVFERMGGQWFLIHHHGSPIVS